MAAKNSSVDGLTKGVEFLFKKNNVEYIPGTGAFSGEHEVKVNRIDGKEQTLRAKNIIVATGSEATPFPGLAIDEKKVVTSTGAIALEEVPKKMVVIGGGIIGLEMASPLVAYSCKQFFVYKLLIGPSRVLSGRGWDLKSPLSNSLARSEVRAWTLRYQSSHSVYSPNKA